MIREANVGDAAAIAGIDVAGSRFAYAGIVPDECLYHPKCVMEGCRSV